jgi:hypothetical protein
MPVDATRFCWLCEEEIGVMEPYFPALVNLPGGDKPIGVCSHVACAVDTIAGKAAVATKGQLGLRSTRRAAPARERQPPATMRELFADLIHHVLTRED